MRRNSFGVAAFAALVLTLAAVPVRPEAAAILPSNGLTILLDADGKITIPTLLQSLDLNGVGMLPLGPDPDPDDGIEEFPDFLVSVRTFLLAPVPGTREIFPLGGVPNSDNAVASGQPALVVEKYTGLPVGIQIESADPTLNFVPTIGSGITFVITVPEFRSEQLVTLDLSRDNLGTQLLDGIDVFGEATGTLGGDFNGDGTVDAADYVVWRKNTAGFGGDEGYEDWRANFGLTVNPSGEVDLVGTVVLQEQILIPAQQQIPEPGSLAFLGIGLAALVAARRRVRPYRRSHLGGTAMPKQRRRLAFFRAFLVVVFCVATGRAAVADPTLVPLDSNGNWVWNVSIAPTSLEGTGLTPLAEELGFVNSRVTFEIASPVMGTRSVRPFDAGPGATIFGWETGDMGGVAEQYPSIPITVRITDVDLLNNFHPALGSEIVFSINTPPLINTWVAAFDPSQFNGGFQAPDGINLLIPITATHNLGADMDGDGDIELLALGALAFQVSSPSLDPNTGQFNFNLTGNVTGSVNPPFGPFTLSGPVTQTQDLAPVLPAVAVPEPGTLGLLGFGLALLGVGRCRKASGRCSKRVGR